MVAAPRPWPARLGEACLGCGLCLDACPRKALSLVKGAVRLTGGCADCAACFEICPVGAAVGPEAAESAHDPLG